MVLFYGARKKSASQEQGLNNNIVEKLDALFLNLLIEQSNEVLVQQYQSLSVLLDSCEDQDVFLLWLIANVEIYQEYEFAMINAKARFCSTQRVEYAIIYAFLVQEYAGGIDDEAVRDFLSHYQGNDPFLSNIVQVLRTGDSQFTDPFNEADPVTMVPAYNEYWYDFYKEADMDRAIFFLQKAISGIEFVYDIKDASELKLNYSDFFTFNNFCKRKILKTHVTYAHLNQLHNRLG